MRRVEGRCEGKEGTGTFRSGLPLGNAVAVVAGKTSEEWGVDWTRDPVAISRFLPLKFRPESCGDAIVVGVSWDEDVLVTIDG